MKLEQVIEESKDIVCENNNELDAVISILEKRGMKPWLNGRGNVVSPCNDFAYWLGSTYFPNTKVTALDFIKSNSENTPQNQ